MATVVCQTELNVLFQILSGGVSFTQIVALLVALVLGISVHEFSHAAMATWLGDTLPRRQGRLTLAPLAHLDVMGSLMFLVAGFGWGKPVQYNPFALRAGPRSGPALVAVAGPLSNVIFAALVAIPIRLMPIVFGAPVSALSASSGPESTLFNLLVNIIFFNLILSMFNLIPVFPLDGFSVLLGILPPELADQFARTQQWGMFILLALILFDRYVNILGMLIDGPVFTLLYLLVRAGS